MIRDNPRCVPSSLSGGLFPSEKKILILNNNDSEKLSNPEREYKKYKKQVLNIEIVIRTKCLFLFAVLDALLLLVTWSTSSTLMMRGRPLTSVMGGGGGREGGDKGQRPRLNRQASSSFMTRAEIHNQQLLYFYKFFIHGSLYF